MSMLSRIPCLLLFVFQSGWGKRFDPYTEDEATVQELATFLGQENDNILSETPKLYNTHEEEKRNWAKFNGGWGKRANSNWNNFRGSLIRFT